MIYALESSNSPARLEIHEIGENASALITGSTETTSGFLTVVYLPLQPPSSGQAHCEPLDYISISQRNQQSTESAAPSAVRYVERLFGIKQRIRLFPCFSFPSDRTESPNKVNRRIMLERAAVTQNSHRLEATTTAYCTTSSINDRTESEAEQRGFHYTFLLLFIKHAILLCYPRSIRHIPSLARGQAQPKTSMDSLTPEIQHQPGQ